MWRPLCLTLILAFSGCQPVPAPQEHHGAMPAGEVGSASVKFETSCTGEVQTDFNRGVALLHSFWFQEARRVFTDIAERDQGCAMAWWGQAMSQWGNPFAGVRAQGIVDGGQALVAKARSTGAPTPRERGLIEAVAHLYRSADAASQRERMLAYEAAMGSLAMNWPDDPELSIFHALAIAQTAIPADKTYADLLRAADILEPLFDKHPDHPGLAHYIIHSFDVPPLAVRALPAARRYAELAPAAPHALHMPSHTFSRVGYWQESIASNRRSADVSRENGETGDELHALDYLTYAYLQTANDAAAKELVARAAGISANAAPGTALINAFAVAAVPARYVIELRDWPAAAALVPHPGSSPATEAIIRFARAVGASRSGNPTAATGDIARLADLRDALTAVPDPYWAEQVDIQQRVALAWQSFAQGRGGEAISQMAAAAELEDRTDKAAVTPGPFLPARESLGELLLQAGRPDEALAAFEAVLDKEPNRFHALAGAGRAATLSGKRDRATGYYTLLLATVSEAGGEASRPELLAARQTLGE
jgi:hypothetical protein